MLILDIIKCDKNGNSLASGLHSFCHFVRLLRFSGMMIGAILNWHHHRKSTNLTFEIRKNNNYIC